MLIGDHFLLGNTKINKLYELTFANIFLSGLAVSLILWLSDGNFFLSSSTSALIFFGSGLGIFQDTLRMFGFATNQVRLIVQADLIWLIMLSSTFLYFKYDEPKLSAENVLLSFFLAALISCLSLFRIKTKFYSNTKSDSSKNIVVHNSQLAFLVILGAGTNHLLNVILFNSIQETILTDIRGLQLLLLPIGFLAGLQQVTWLPRIDKHASRFEIDWQTLRILGWLSPIILVLILYFGSERLGTLGYWVGLTLFLEMIFAFFTTQVSLSARAKKDLTKYLFTRILWSSLAIIFTILAVRSESIIYVSAGLMSATLIAFLFALRTNK